jgi:hypothetical protein
VNTINGLDGVVLQLYVVVSSKELKYRRWELIKVGTRDAKPKAASGHNTTYPRMVQKKSVLPLQCYGFSVSHRSIS